MARLTVEFGGGKQQTLRYLRNRAGELDNGVAGRMAPAVASDSRARKPLAGHKGCMAMWFPSLGASDLTVLGGWPPALVAQRVCRLRVGWDAASRSSRQFYGPPG